MNWSPTAAGENANANQGAGAEADGPSVSPGDIVVDTEADSTTEAVVVNTPQLEAAEWTVPGRGRLSRLNPDYPATDGVVIVLERTVLEREYPYYADAGAIRMDRLKRDAVEPQAFPASRLRQVGKLEPSELPLEKIEPSPYHSRTYDLDQNRTFIEEISDRGYPDPTPYVRHCGNRFEVIDGNKRLWASRVAGLNVVPCRCGYLDDVTAAKKWVASHYETYDAVEMDEARKRLRSKFGSQAADIEAAGKRIARR